MELWVQQRQQNLIEDRLVLLTHPPVITYGARTPPEELPAQGRSPLSRLIEAVRRPTTAPVS